MTASSHLDPLKRQAALRAVTLVEDGMAVGLGTGSTACYFVEALGSRVRDGLNVVCVPTSEATRLQALNEKIPLSTLDTTPYLDLCVDGADEVDLGLRLIKGGGGALLREKIVARASARMVVICDETKLVDTLGRFPLPIEVVRFGLHSTLHLIAETLGKLGYDVLPSLRINAYGEVFSTDSGHVIVDAALKRIDDPEKLGAALSGLPGVVEHGLFLNIASGLIVASTKGVAEYGKV